MTRIVYDPAQLRLEMEGHAGAGVYGQDPVCAALSMLGMTLEKRVSELAESCFPTLSRAPGRFLVVCRPEAGAEAQCREIFETVAAGLALLSEEKPEHVSFRREEDEDEEECQT
ncbi:MAG: ribosomal-processing cysteine protease Prp [Oscillospiraceae bacterium]|nr:ribosomal-processing cysteine protease Prp [Oscillospiraceae bacterium]